MLRIHNKLLYFKTVVKFGCFWYKFCWQNVLVKAKGCCKVGLVHQCNPVWVCRGRTTAPLQFCACSRATSPSPGAGAVTLERTWRCRRYAPLPASVTPAPMKCGPRLWLRRTPVVDIKINASGANSFVACARALPLPSTGSNVSRRQQTETISGWFFSENAYFSQTGIC